jgi:ATP-binding cassette subfamily B protein
VALDGRIRWRSLARLRDALVCNDTDTLGSELHAVLTDAGLSPAKRQKVNHTLMQERLAQQPIGTCWRLRTPQHAHWWHHLRQAHLPHHVVVFMGANVLFYFLLILSWWVVGRHALREQMELDWLSMWAVLLLALIPIRVVAVRAQGYLTVGLSHLLKQWLLLGALRLNPDRICYMGAGQFIGTLIESEAVEAFFLNGGFFLMVLSVIKLVFAIGIATTVGLFYFSVLAGYLAMAALVIWLYFRRCRIWTHARIQVTYTLIERMVGHRTRLWLVAALLALAPAWVSSSTSVAALAVALGGMLLAYQGLDGLTKGVTYLISAIISWAYVTPFLHADPPSNRITSSWRLPRDSSVAPVDETAVPYLAVRHPRPGQPADYLRMCAAACASSDGYRASVSPQVELSI